MFTPRGPIAGSFQHTLWPRERGSLIGKPRIDVRLQLVKNNHSYYWFKVKVKPLYKLKWPIGPVLNSGFLSMKRLGVLLLPPEWDASPTQGYPQYICWYPFVHLGEEKHCGSKVSCPRTQHNDPGQGSNPNTRSGVECTNHETTAPFIIYWFSQA